jgi:pimeloyl-ACP methyl ester carboxylesterase
VLVATWTHPTGAGSGFRGGAVSSAVPMSYPAGLHVDRASGRPIPRTGLVLVHGSLDRAESFRRVMRRLPDLRILAYDRRGYQGRGAPGVVDLGGHVADLLEIVARSGPGPGVLSWPSGHSLGGDVVVGAALAEPQAFDSIGAFEPPMPWLGFRRTDPGSDRPREWTPLAEDPGVEAERFFSRMVSPSAWRRLTDEGRAQRRADGPALVADLRSMRGEALRRHGAAVPAFRDGGRRPGPPPPERGLAGRPRSGAEAYEIAGPSTGPTSRTPTTSPPSCAS